MGESSKVSLYSRVPEDLIASLVAEAHMMVSEAAGG